MAEAEPGSAGGYAAFISYSHKDAAVGRWLHRRLEGYRLPKRLIGTSGEDGEVPARLIPIFRDREELPAAGDLSEKVRAALALSRNLIVICSPNSAASPWVAKEIATFRELHPDRPIFAAIVEGEPDQCFPAPLCEGGAEPLAADLRREGDGRRLGLLKLVAGLAGVGLDALVQRDAARRVRRVTYLTAAAVAAMLVMALLTAFALNARAETERQRREAEDIVEFMLTDLRTKLKGVKRLDIFDSVNQRALRHYASQDLEDLPPDALERRARLLHQIGEDDLERGEPDRALARFREAARTTAALLADDPDNPERIFAHSQSEFWVGNVDYNRENFAAAKLAFERYRALAERLVSLNSTNVEWVKEAGYATGNLCVIALEPPRDPRRALRLCTVALQRMEQAQELGGTNPATVEAVLNRHLWMMKAWNANGRWDQVLHHKARQEELMHALLRSDPANMDYRDIWMRTQFGIAEILLDHGDVAEAGKRLDGAATTASLLRRHDPANADWRLWERRITTAQAKLK
ncbi:MAG TPA: toll/interleukin-1 receptor domain-containing protein [Allosphingosinicella sp.]|jgi:hypothetical protein